LGFCSDGYAVNFSNENFRITDHPLNDTVSPLLKFKISNSLWLFPGKAVSPLRPLLRWAKFFLLPRGGVLAFAFIGLLGLLAFQLRLAVFLSLIPFYYVTSHSPLLHVESRYFQPMYCFTYILVATGWTLITVTVLSGMRNFRLAVGNVRKSNE
jgi:hypothetical protein